MNYYEHHIGDYAEATAHLSFVEDAAYSRLIRKYYAQEKPLPADLKQVQRLVGARERTERAAVETVLNEFFVLREDGWHNDRCDDEIAKFRDGEPEREAKKANEENRLKRHREERARLFKQLTDAGQHAAWNIGMNELRELVKGLPETDTETLLPPLPETAPATPATATQTPDTRHQTPVLKPLAHSATTQPELARGPETPETVEKPEPTPAASLSQAMRKHGVMSQPGDPRLIALAEQGVTVETIEAACEEAKQAKPGERIGPAYVAAIVQRWSAEAKSIDAAGAKPPKPNGKSSDDWTWRKSNEGIDRKGREMGMYARGGESYADFASRIQAAIDKRKAAERGQGATA